MISIEAYRASIGRFSGKAKFLSQRKACLKSEGIDPALLLLFVMLLEVVLYGLIFTTNDHLLYIHQGIIYDDCDIWILLLDCQMWF